MSTDVIVIGGGFAGISAAVRFAQQGAKVLLLEKKPFLGGRVYSIPERKTGDEIDNGQHVVMGCYHEMMDLLRLLGTDTNIAFQEKLSIDYRWANGTRDRLVCPGLPAPLHLLTGLMRMQSLSWSDKLIALRFGLTLRKKEANLPRESVQAFCGRLKQPKILCDTMWNAIAVSALNEKPDKADAGLFRTVMRQAFLAKADDSCMGLPTVPLQGLHGEHVASYLSAHNGEVRLRQRVESLGWESERITSVKLSSGEEIACGVCVMAVPTWAARPILEHSGLSERVNIPGVGTSPILSVFLWYDQEFSNETITCLQETTFEWIFHRNRFMQPNAHKHYCVCLVVSACRELQGYSRDRLIKLALEDVHQTYPESHSSNLLAATVFWETRATFSATVYNAQNRLSPKTALQNLFLAGDWTDTGLPATIEGAVISGKKCAEEAR